MGERDGRRDPAEPDGLVWQLGRKRHLAGETSLGGIDLYSALPGAFDAIRSWGRHPLPFYQRLGFHVIGVMPDANGSGGPDMFLGRRLAPDVGAPAGQRSLDTFALCRARRLTNAASHCHGSNQWPAPTIGYADARPAVVRLSDRARLRNANTHAIALTGSTSAVATTASPATASGGAYVGSRVAPGT